MRVCVSFSELVISDVLSLSYLSEREHPAWSILEDEGDLSQVGGVLHDQRSVSADGQINEGQLSSKLLCPGLHLVCLRVLAQSSVSADVDLKS